EVVALSSPVIAATIISKAPSNPAETAAWKIPPAAISASISDLIARWSGWSLTVPMPGKTDGKEPNDDAKKGRPFFLLCTRDGWPNVLRRERDSWLMPPLRFGKEYEFCLRRADLAGNHLFDEGR